VVFFLFKNHPIGRRYDPELAGWKMRLEAVKESPASGRGRRNRLPHL
jgi:hypothetical protein